MSDWLTLEDENGHEIYFRCSRCGVYINSLYWDYCDCGVKGTWVGYGCLLVMREEVE